MMPNVRTWNILNCLVPMQSSKIYPTGLKGVMEHQSLSSRYIKYLKMAKYSKESVVLCSAWQCNVYQEALYPNFT